jgi:Na+-driven multidrug efflux pump
MFDTTFCQKCIACKPMILSMALQAVYNIVDSAFVGNIRVGSEAALNI